MENIIDSNKLIAAFVGGMAALSAGFATVINVIA